MQIIEKPWGREEIIEKNDSYVLKKLVMNSGEKCSLQYHEEKHETFYVLSGKLKFTYGKSKDELHDKELQPGDSFVIDIGVIHRMEALEDSEYLEASTNHLDDVVRISDNYGRS
jgi:mannose-6-phosphate isomerase-like protein (cupin superfamily)